MARVCALLAALAALAVTSGRAQTTAHLETVLLGRCFERSPSTNCTRVVDAFAEAARARWSPDVTPSSYDALASLVDFTTPRDKALFWSGRQGVACLASLDRAPPTPPRPRPAGQPLRGAWRRR